jgi:cytosine/adenosine deaminase-related metal-dependent hydrolase
MFEESRAIEMNRRLITNQRGVHSCEELLTAATVNGAKSLGHKTYGLVAGAAADFVAVSTDSVRLASFDAENGAAHLVHSATSADVRDVWVGGDQIVKDGVHRAMPDVAGALRSAINALL